MNRLMRDYIITYREKILPSVALTDEQAFTCKANNVKHAIEKFENAYPHAICGEVTTLRDYYNPRKQ